MIAAWQKKAGAPATGFLTAAQRDELLRTERRAVAVEVRRAEESRGAKEARRRQEEIRCRPSGGDAGFALATDADSPRAGDRVTAKRFRWHLYVTQSAASARHHYARCRQRPRFADDKQGGLQHGANGCHDFTCGRNQWPGRPELSARRRPGGQLISWPSNDQGAHQRWECHAYSLHEPGRSLNDTQSERAARRRPLLRGRTAQRRRRRTRRPIGVAGRAVARHLFLYCSQQQQEPAKLHPRSAIEACQRNQLWRGCSSEPVE